MDRIKRKIDNNFPNRKNDLINTFIEELKNALKNIMNEGIDMDPKKDMKK